MGAKSTFRGQCLCFHRQLPPNRCHRLQVCVIVCWHCQPPLYSTNCELPLLLAAPSIREGAARWSRCGRASVAELTYAPPLQSARKNLQTLSSRFNSLGDTAYESSPVIDALIIRDRKIRRPWLQDERANQKRRCAAHFTAIDCNLHSISTLFLPSKA